MFGVIVFRICCVSIQLHTYGLNKQHYQPAVLLQYLSNAKEYISAQWSDHPFWTAVEAAKPRSQYSRLRKKLKKNCSNRCINEGNRKEIIKKSALIGREILSCICIELMKKDSISSYTECFILCLTLSAIGCAGQISYHIVVQHPSITQHLMSLGEIATANWWLLFS